MAEEEPHADDVVAIQRVLGGDVDAFADLLARHRDGVLRVVARHVPRDRVPEVAHDVFVSAFGSLRRYEPRKPFARWLGRIALREAAEFWRREYRHHPRGEALDEAPPRPRDGVEDRELIEWGLRGLPLDDRLAVTLVHLEELSMAEAAEVLGWTVSKVKVRAHRGRHRLRERLDPEMNEGEKPR